MNNPYLQEIAAKEKSATGNPYLDEIAAKERPIAAGTSKAPLPGRLLSGNLPPSPDRQPQLQPGNPNANFDPFGQGGGVQDPLTKQPVSKRQVQQRGTGDLRKLDQPPLSGPTNQDVIQGLGPKPFAQAPKPPPAQKPVPQGQEVNTAVKNATTYAKEGPKVAPKAKPPLAQGTFRLPIFGRVNWRQSGVGYEADFPVVGTVKGGSIADLVKNAHKAYEQIKTTMAGPNFAAYEPSMDKMQPPNVQQSGIRTERLLTDAQLKEEILAKPLENVAKTLNPLTMPQRIAEAMGAPKFNGAEGVKDLLDVPAIIGANLVANTIALPMDTALVIRDPNATWQDKLGASANLFLAAATAGTAPGGKSALDEALRWIGSKFDNGEKFAKALDDLPLKPEEKQTVKKFFEESQTLDPPPAPRTITKQASEQGASSFKGKPFEAEVYRGTSSSGEGGFGGYFGRGKYYAPTHEEAAWYAGESGKVEKSTLRLEKPKIISESDFRKLIPAGTGNMVDDAAKLTDRWLDEGYDGLILTNDTGKHIEYLKFERDSRTATKPPIQETNVKPKVEPPKPTYTPPKEKVEAGDSRALANRSADIARRLIGEDVYRGVPKESVEKWAKAAVEKGYHEPSKAHSIAKEILEGGKKHLDNEETLGLAAATKNLEDQFDSIAKKLQAKPGGDVELSKQLGDVADQIRDITKAGSQAGTEWGRSGAARAALMKADGSFAGLLARRQNAVKRNLTTDEIKGLKARADELEAIRDAQAKRITELQKALDVKGAQETLSTHAKAGGSKATGEKLAKVERKIQDVSERLKTKWAENKPANVAKSSLFGADIVLEQAARVGKIAPEILELAKLHVEKGAISLAENTKAVVKHLRSLGIDDIEENDVAGVLSGRVKAEGEKRALTDYETLRREASAAFRDADKARAEQLAFIQKREKEIQKTARNAQRQTDLDAIKAEREQIKAEAKAAREAENAFWKEVRENQKEFDKAAREARASDRKTAIARWKASAAGRRAQSLTRIEDLSEKLDYHRETGHMLGAKSMLAEPDDDVLKGLRIKERSIERQLLQEDHVARQAQIKKDRTFVEKSLEFPSEIFGSIRNMLAVGDVSWNGIQGSLILYTNPKAWVKGTGGSLKALFSKNSTFIDDMEKLREIGMFDKIVASGVDLPGLQPGHIDEFFAETFLDAFPIYKNIRKGSQQAYDAGATITRAGIVESWIKGIESTGRPLDLDGLKVLGEAANTLTGKASGKGGRLVSSLPAAGKTIFAPSWWLSQFQSLSGKPLRDALSYGAKSGDWRIAKLMAGEYAKLTAGTMGTLFATAYALDKARAKGLTDWHIGTDPNDKNFGKAWANRGGTMISVDFLPPQIAAPVKFTAQTIFGTRTDKGTLDRSPFTRQRSLGSTFEGKYAPGLRIGFGVMDSMYAKDNPGKDMVPSYPFGQNLDPRQAEGLGNLAKQSFTPIAWQQATKGITSNKLSPVERGVLGFLSLFGRGPTIYETKK